MITIDCPWCAEPADLDESSLDELGCDACGVAVAFAADPIADRIDRAA